MLESYLTIGNSVTGEIIEKRSRFIAAVSPASTETQANEFISQIKTTHYSARHNCFAYVLMQPKLERYSDDGEPQGTAGIPMLEIIKNRKLTDCVCVVTRYFGGVLLGTGGLLRAYSGALCAALDNSKIVKMRLCDELFIKCDYTQYARLPSLISSFEGNVSDTAFTECVTVSFSIPCDKCDSFNRAIVELYNGKLKAVKTGQKYMEFANVVSNIV